MPCPYYNEEKNSIASGIYCNCIDGRPGNAYWSRYCNSDSSRCPHRGGDDPYELHPDTVRRREEKERRARAIQEYNNDSQKKETSASNYEYRGGGGGRVGIGDIVSDFMTKVFAAIAAILIIVGAIFFVGGKLGIIKSRVNVVAKMPENSSISIEEVSLHAIVQDGENKETIAQFDKNGECKLKIHPGINDVYVEYDGASIFLNSYKGNGLIWHSVDLDMETAEVLMVRMVLLDFQDENNQVITPENLKVFSSENEETTCRPINETSYVCGFSNASTQETLKISVDGYEEVEIPLDLGNRINHVKVNLKAK